MRRHGLILLTALALVAACGDAAEDATTTTTSTTLAVATTTTEPSTTTTAAAPETTTTTTEAPAPTLPDPPYLTVGDSALGTIVTDDEGMTLYVFLPDAQGPSTCTGACAVTWPPFVGDVAAGPGVDPDLMGQVTRGDGSTQVTYDGWPLYFYAPDMEPGQTRGQSLGGNWWVIAPDGRIID